MKPITSIIIAVSFVFCVSGPMVWAKGRGHEEKTINNSNVPAAVQQAGDKEAKGGRIVRWEREGKNYEAVIDKNGKQWGIEIDPAGKVLSKHDETAEHKMKGEKQ